MSLPTIIVKEGRVRVLNLEEFVMIDLDNLENGVCPSCDAQLSTLQCDECGIDWEHWVEP